MEEDVQKLNPSPEALGQAAEALMKDGEDAIADALLAHASKLGLAASYATLDAVLNRVERFGRRGTEPFEPFEFFQNRNFPECFLTKSKNFRKFQHFLNCRRNSDKNSSKSEQKSVKKNKKNEILQILAKKCEKI